MGKHIFQLLLEPTNLKNVGKHQEKSRFLINMFKKLCFLGKVDTVAGASRSQTYTCTPGLRLSQGQVKPKSGFAGARLGLTRA